MIYYASRTGNVKYIVSKLNAESKLIESDSLVNCEFLLFTYTDGLGSIPNVVLNFMDKNYKKCKGIVCSGNSNFGNNVFCGAGEKLSLKYGIRLLRKIELRGFDQDYIYLQKVYDDEFRKGF